MYILERARVKNRFPRFGAPIPLMDGFLHDIRPHLTAPLHNNTTFFLNEAPEVCKPDLHPLVDDLSDLDQVLRNCRNVQHVHDLPFLPDMAQRNFSDIRDGMWSVVSGCDYSWLHWFFQVREPLLMACHVV